MKIPRTGFESVRSRLANGWSAFSDLHAFAFLPSSIEATASLSVLAMCRWKAFPPGTNCRRLAAS
jgi:hypothetical protein